MADFVILALGSIGIGLLAGLIGSYFLKKFRFLTVSAIKETLVIFSMGYLSYSIGELVHVSGIISLLTTGIIMAHYGWYNLSPQGKVLSSASIQVIGFGLEAFVFAYLGLSFFSLYEQDWSYQFILYEAAICIIARFIGTVCLLYLTALCKHKRQVSFRQVLFVCYAGLIRGAIAFGLVLKLDGMPELVNPAHLPVIRTTALTLVISTTLFFGSTMQMVQKALIPPLSDMQIARQLVGKTKFEALVKEIGEENEDDEEDKHQDYLTEQLIVKNANHRPTEEKKLILPSTDINKTSDQEKKKSPGHRHSINSEHEEFLHPNMRESIIE